MVNIGAGSGSYEPTDLQVVPVEPSETMIRQRPGSLPRALLGTAHVKAGELIPSRLLSPIEIQQILGVAEPENV